MRTTVGSHARGKDHSEQAEGAGVRGFPEYARLRRVLMHSPGDEIDRIHPTTFRRYLFEDAIEPAEFRRQHERLVETLRGERVQVLLLGDVLGSSPLSKLARTSPNLVYTRDAVVVTRAGSIGMRMHSPIRRHEPRIASAAVSALGAPSVMGVRAPGTMEGGDLIFLDEETLLVGVGNRTNRHGLGQLQKGLSGLRRIVAIDLPPWAIHLDGTMMILDRDLAVVHPESLRGRAIVREAGRLPRRTTALRFLKEEGFHTVSVTAYERGRRATNLITLGPRKVVGYAGHARVRRMLLDEGADVLEVEGSELVRGGGGPRCMTAPVLREDGSRLSVGMDEGQAGGWSTS